METMTHADAVDTMAAERYLLDDMSELERHEFEEHYFSCTECAGAVRDGDAMREAARQAAPASRVVPIGLHRRETATGWAARLRPAVVAPLAAAAALAMIAGYQSLVVIPSLRDGLAARAIVPIVLRPATRAAVPAVAVTPRSVFLALEPELSADPTAPVIAYRVNRN